MHKGRQNVRQGEKEGRERGRRKGKGRKKLGAGPGTAVGFHQPKLTQMWHSFYLSW